MVEEVSGRVRANTHRSTQLVRSWDSPAQALTGCRWEASHKKKEILDKLDTTPLFSLNEANQNINLCLYLITLKYQLNCRSSLKPNRARFLFSFLHPWACRHVRKEASGLTVFGPRPAAVSVSVWVFGRMGVWVYGPTYSTSQFFHSQCKSMPTLVFVQSTSSQFGRDPFHHPSIMKPTLCVYDTSTLTRTVDFEMCKQHEWRRDT